MSDPKTKADSLSEQKIIKEKQSRHKELRLENLIKNVPVDKLKDFIITHAKNNTGFYNNIIETFTVHEEKPKESTRGNKYSKIINSILMPAINSEKNETGLNTLDQWVQRAKELTVQNKYSEAVLICKAVIEEYSKWISVTGEEVTPLFSAEYQILPFKILEEAAEFTDKRGLYNYCLAELKRNKYSGAGFDFINNFHHLLGSLAATIDPQEFIAFEDDIFASLEDKSSYEAEKILGRKVTLYRRLGMEEIAWDVIEKNVQIDSFCLLVVEDRIKNNDLDSAKRIVNDFISRQLDDPNRFINSKWYNLFLELMDKENSSIPGMSELVDLFNRKMRAIKRYST